MDSPHIRYATSTDGTEIAYAVLGSGPPLVFTATFLSPLSVRLSGQRFVSFYETLAGKRTLILFDWRGSGLSGPAREFSLGSFAGDLKSVVDHLALAYFDLCGSFNSCHVALEFAASNPQRVRKLVLQGPYPRGESARTGREVSPIAHLISSDWDVFAGAYALRRFG